MNKLVISTFLTLFLSASSAAHSEPNAVAVQRKVEICIGCHDIPAYRTGFPEVYRVPKLGGQNAKYIEAALQEYKKGTRKVATMHAIAASLTDQDIAEIAAYYAAQKKADKRSSKP